MHALPRLLAFTVALAPFLPSVLGCAGQAPRPAVRPSPLLGTQLDLTALDQAGQLVRIQGGKGRVVVVDFFASWCEPCKVQLPHLDELDRNLRDQGLAVYGVSFDETEEAFRGFGSIMGVGVRFPVLWDPGGERLSQQLSIQRLPTTLVADRTGAIRSVHVGYDAREGAKLEAEVRAALAEPVPRAVDVEEPLDAGLNPGAAPP